MDFLKSFDFQTVLSVVSALFAIVSAIFSFRAARRAEGRAGINLKMAYDSDIIAWSDEVILVLARAQEMLIDKGVSYPDQEFASRRSETRAHLSALIDRGRIFFPNLKSEKGHGAEKEMGYQGHRQTILNELVAAYDAVDTAGAKPGPDPAACEEVRKRRRAFVGEMFKTVDPERRGSRVKELSA